MQETRPVARIVRDAGVLEEDLSAGRRVRGPGRPALTARDVDRANRPRLALRLALAHPAQRVPSGGRVAGEARDPGFQAPDRGDRVERVVMLELDLGLG